MKNKGKKGGKSEKKKKRGKENQDCLLNFSFLMTSEKIRFEFLDLSGEPAVSQSIIPQLSAYQAANSRLTFAFGM